MKKRIVLAIAALLPLAIAYAATQGDTPVAKAELAPTQAQAQADHHDKAEQLTKNGSH